MKGVEVRVIDVPARVVVRKEGVVSVVEGVVAGVDAGVRKEV